MSIQRTFSIIKPDAVAAGKAGKVLAVIEGAGFKILGLAHGAVMRKQQAEAFYAVHKERPFFGSLVKFMTEGPVIVMALEREDAVAKLREIMGATNPANAAEGTDPQAVCRQSSNAMRFMDRMLRKRLRKNCTFSLRRLS